MHLTVVSCLARAELSIFEPFFILQAGHHDPSRHSEWKATECSISGFQAYISLAGKCPLLFHLDFTICLDCPLDSSCAHDHGSLTCWVRNLTVTLLPIQKQSSGWKCKNCPIVQDSLGGNSKTMIIATVSPASWSFPPPLIGFPPSSTIGTVVRVHVNCL